MHVQPRAPTHSHPPPTPAPCRWRRPAPRAPTHPHPCALQMAWDPEQQSQEECPVVRVQVLGET